MNQIICFCLPLLMRNGQEDSKSWDLSPFLPEPVTEGFRLSLGPEDLLQEAVVKGKGTTGRKVLLFPFRNYCPICCLVFHR